jgi:hypothetical protein
MCGCEKGDTDSDAPVGGTTLQGSVNTILRVNEDGTDRNLGMLLADRIHRLPHTLPHLDFAYLKVFRMFILSKDHF